MLPISQRGPSKRNDSFHYMLQINLVQLMNKCRFKEHVVCCFVLQITL